VATRYCGFMGKILDVDLSTGRVGTYEVSDEDYASLLGGKGLGSRILYDIVPAGADPLGPDNALVFTPGVLTGSGAPCSSRHNLSTKNVLTGGIGSTNCGGTFGTYLKLAGADGLIVRGKADHPVWIEVLDGEVTIHDARHLWGLDTEATQAALPEEVSKVVIGPAGESLVRYASVLNGKRVLARCGVGAVMGSKLLKGITAGGCRRVPVYDREGFAKAVASWTKVLKSHPTTGEQLPRFGTAALVNLCDATHTLTTRNFSAGSIEGADELGGETMAETILAHNGACRSCPIRCSREKVVIDGRAMKGPEFETIGLLGSNLGHTDLAMVTRLSERCDQLGLDTISAGGTLGFAMELTERGMLQSDLRFGKTDNLLQTLEDIAHRRGLGDELAEGSMRLADKHGGMEFAPQAKGMEYAAYEPRGAAGHGLGYAVSNRGGCHINGGYMIFFEATGPMTMDPHTPLGKPAFVVFQQNMFDAVSSAGCCIFTTYAVIPGGGERFLNPHGRGGVVFAEILKAARFVLNGQGRLPAWALPIHLPLIPHTKAVATLTGIDCTLGHFALVGERTYTIERMFNVREGFDRRDDSLPRRVTDEPERAHEPRSRVPLDEMLPVYYKVRDWEADGRPSERLLDRLGLASMIPALRKARAQGGVPRKERLASDDAAARERIPEALALVRELDRGRPEIDRAVRHAEASTWALEVRASSFRVDRARCQRCGLCADDCPVDAIAWSKGQLAEIDQGTCIRCGRCWKACPPRFSAIAMGSAKEARLSGPVYRIDDDKCTYCGLCAKRCPVTAIAWERKKLACIDEELCVRCGRCKAVCPEKWDAVDVIHSEA
jgi:aldehyde:ferredoxin oxidoreductase